MKRDNNYRGSVVHHEKWLLAAAIASVIHPVWAQEDEQKRGLEEVVVTAERRDASIQDIPTSMTALTGEQLEKKSVTRMEDLQFASPGLSVTDAGLTQSVNIRGIGLASGDPDVTNGVGTYIDGLFQPPIVSNLSMYDINDVQVLRGPQGTFAGANSTGGAIMINSRRPQIGEDINGYVNAGLGDYDALNMQGAVSLPVSETLALRAAMNTRNRDSFYKNVGSANTDAGSLEETSGRLSMVWTPIEALEVYAKYENAEISTGGFAYRPIVSTAYAEGRTDDIRDLDYNTPTANDADAETLLFDARYTFANGIALRVLSGDQEKSIENTYDTDGTSLASETRDQRVVEDQVSHEINLISSDEAKLQWVLGYYYQQNKVDVDINNGPFPVDIYIDNEKTIRGAFGQVGYFVTDDLQVELGMRKAWFEAWANPDSGVFVGNGIDGFPPGGARVATISGDYDDNDLLGKFSVNWTFDADNLLYGFVAKGYKPGGINSETSTFDSEQVMTYEAGWKSTMMDGNLQTTASVFYSDYKDFQNQAIDLSTGRSDVYNIAEATIKGIELSAEGQIGALRFDASLSYIDSNLEPTTALVDTRALPGNNLGPQCADGTTSNPPVCFDYTPYLLGTSGGSNLYAPKLSYTVGAEYAFDLSNGASLTPRINYGWLDEQWTNLLYNEETDLLKSRGLLSAMLTYEVEQWKLQAYGRNLTNEEYITGQEATFNTEFYGAPRQYGLTAAYQF